MAALRLLLGDLGGRIGVQFGAPTQICLDRNRFTALLSLDRNGTAAAVRTRAELLPIPSSSVDVLVLVHELDRQRERGAVIREAARVLRGEGRLVVIGLRPLAPAGLAAWLCGPRAGLRPHGTWGLRALMVGNGLAWEGCLRVGALCAAKGVRRVSSMTPLRPQWGIDARRRGGAVGVPGAGHAG